MVIINTDAWEDPEEDKAPLPAKEEELFGFQDLASDYYQVLRQRSRPRIFKVIWGVIISMLMIFTFYLIYLLLYTYFQHNSFNTSSTNWKNNVTLPAITICSTNFINHTALEIALVEGSDNYYWFDLEEQYESVMGDIVEHDGKGYITDDEDFHYDAFIKLYSWEYYYGSLVKFRNDIDSMIVGQYDYFFSSVGSRIKNTARVTLPTELGICIEVNDNGLLEQSQNGVRGGFTIDLNANLDVYLPTTGTKGFVVFIRDQDETVMLNQGGYVISPGTETFMKLTAKSVTRLQEPWGTCSNVESKYARYTDTRYETVRECIQRQKIEAMYEVCGCMPWYLVNRMYTIGKTDVLDEALDIIESNRYYTGPYTGPTYYTSQPANQPTVEPTNSTNTTDSGRKKRSSNMRDLPRVPVPNIKQKDAPPHHGSGRNENIDLKNSENTTGNNADTGTTPPPGFTTYTPWTWGYDSTEEWNSGSIDKSSDYYYNTCTFVFQSVCDIFLEHAIVNNTFVLKGCPEPCAYNEYDVEISTSVFPPTEEYYNRFIKDNIKRDTAPTFEYAKENIARIHIYYDDIKVDHVDQEAAYEIQNVIAEFGGTVDLFIGFSFFTIFQLIEIAIAACCWKCCRRNINNDLPPDIEKDLHLSPPEISKDVKAGAPKEKDVITNEYAEYANSDV